KSKQLTINGEQYPRMNGDSSALNNNNNNNFLSPNMAYHGYMGRGPPAPPGTINLNINGQIREPFILIFMNVEGVGAQAKPLSRGISLRTTLDQF
ncbi:Hypothetical protein FKW44_013897, partial [Caligus rogercresseyi]